MVDYDAKKRAIRIKRIFLSSSVIVIEISHGDIGGLKVECSTCRCRMRGSSRSPKDLNHAFAKVDNDMVSWFHPQSSQDYSLAMDQDEPAQWPQSTSSHFPHETIVGIE
jgi:hypothetical protein